MVGHDRPYSRAAGQPGGHLVALADVRAEPLDRAARHYGVARTYTDYGEMLAQDSWTVS